MSLSALILRQPFETAIHCDGGRRPSNPSINSTAADHPINAVTTRSLTRLDKELALACSTLQALSEHGLKSEALPATCHVAPCEPGVLSDDTGPRNRLLWVSQPRFIPSGASLPATPPHRAGTAPVRSRGRKDGGRGETPATKRSAGLPQPCSKAESAVGPGECSPTAIPTSRSGVTDDSKAAFCRWPHLRGSR